MKTAIEWLVEEIKTLIDNGYVFNPKWEQPMIEEAIEMEKQQIIDAYRNGRCDQQSSRESIFFSRMSERYYNETFNK